MLDTNVLLSMLLFPGFKMERLLLKIVSNYQLVLSSIVITELLAVVHRKFTGKEEATEKFLAQLPYEYYDLPDSLEPGLFVIRDKSDYPVLYAAILANVDLFITGDKDFLNLDIDSPKILTPAEFINHY